ncbi:FliH/SctL family protein [Leifsonia naganoensis]|uniref:Flagellar assembly protein FliH n=1 Tax=Leifsonia naganoensis TaxID=150025 RepID=A0A853DUQ9_9MICO|nr:FliH/SctL family protein [Leifsonia naganoensis]NYK09860.1 flagellar assembly protein FliH [Leifsonia naganoensis]
MSNDTAFAPLAIPVLAETAQEQAALASARSRGYATGFADGRRAAAEEQAAWLAAADEARALQEEQVSARIGVLAQALRAAAVELREATVPVLAEVEDVLVEAAFELASAVVGDALGDRVAAARAAVARALSGETAGEVAVVRLNPDDLALLVEAEAEAEEQAASGGNARTSSTLVTGIPAPRLVPDPSIAPGDAIGELPAGWLDARISTALARAREALS